MCVDNAFFSHFSFPFVLLYNLLQQNKTPGFRNFSPATSIVSKLYHVFQILTLGSCSIGKHLFRASADCTKVSFIIPKSVLYKERCSYNSSTQITITLTDDGDIDCSDGTRQYFPDPESCNHFYLCSNGTPYRQVCPPGLVFNPNINVCDTPDSYPCEDPTSSKDKIYSCQEPDGKFPSPSDCHTFYVCTSNKPSLKTCPGDTEFNSEYGICTSSRFASCSLEQELK